MNGLNTDWEASGVAVNQCTLGLFVVNVDTWLPSVGNAPLQDIQIPDSVSLKISNMSVSLNALEAACFSNNFFPATYRSPLISLGPPNTFAKLNSSYDIDIYIIKKWNVGRTIRTTPSQSPFDFAYSFRPSEVLSYFVVIDKLLEMFLYPPN